MLCQPAIEEFEPLFVRARVFHHLGALVDDAPRVFAAHNVVKAQEHVGGVLDDVKPCERFARNGVQHLLRHHGEGAVLPHVAGVKGVLAVFDAQNDHPARLVQKKSIAVNGAQRFVLIGVHSHKGHFFQQGVARVFAIGHVGGNGSVRLPQHAQQKTLAHLVQLAGKKRARGAAL